MPSTIPQLLRAVKRSSRLPRGLTYRCSTGVEGCDGNRCPMCAYNIKPATAAAEIQNNIRRTRCSRKFTPHRGQLTLAALTISRHLGHLRRTTIGHPARIELS
jgi:hypothetical protein